MEEEGEDVNFISYVVLIIIFIVLFLAFRKQIEYLFVWLFDSFQTINK